MTKHRRFLDKQKDDFTENVEKIELEEENSTPKNGMDLKSILLSGSKYVYIIAAAALLSGIFTPLTLGVEIERVLSGMFSLFLGLGGGIAIFLGTKNQKFTTIMKIGRASCRERV